MTTVAFGNGAQTRYCIWLACGVRVDLGAIDGGYSVDLEATLLLPSRYHTHSNHQTKSQGFRAGHSACMTRQARHENSMRDGIVPLKPGEVLRFRTPGHKRWVLYAGVAAL